MLLALVVAAVVVVVAVAVVVPVIAGEIGEDCRLRAKGLVDFGSCGIGGGGEFAYCSATPVPLASNID